MVKWCVRSAAVLGIALVTGCFQGPTAGGPLSNGEEPPAPPSPILDAQGTDDADEVVLDLDVPAASDDAHATASPDSDASEPPASSHAVPRFVWHERTARTFTGARPACSLTRRRPRNRRRPGEAEEGKVIASSRGGGLNGGRRVEGGSSTQPHEDDGDAEGADR